MNQILCCIRAGKMAVSCHWGLHSVSHKKIVFFLDIINPLLTKLVWARWLDIGLMFLFLHVCLIHVD